MLTIRRTRTPEEKAQVFALTERVYRAHRYISEDCDFHAILCEMDAKYDTTYLMALPEGKSEPVAAISLMASPTLLLPTEQYLDIDLVRDFGVPRTQIWEFSRLVSEVGGRDGFKGLLGLIFATCDFTLRQGCLLGTANMSPETITEIERTTQLQLIHLNFFDTSKTYPAHYDAWFKRQPKQGFVVQEAGGREFIERMRPRLDGFGIVLDL
jgi:hypothetical protein